jgi:hypothetical protein
MALTCSAVSLKGLSYRNSTSVTGGMVYQSMFGGTPIFIRANGGLDDIVPQNNVLLESQQIAGAVFTMKPISSKFSFFFSFYSIELKVMTRLRLIQ